MQSKVDNEEAIRRLRLRRALIAWQRAMAMATVASCVYKAWSLHIVRLFFDKFVQYMRILHTYRKIVRRCTEGREMRCLRRVFHAIIHHTQRRIWLHHLLTNAFRNRRNRCYSRILQHWKAYCSDRVHERGDRLLPRPAPREHLIGDALRDGLKLGVVGQPALAPCGQSRDRSGMRDRFADPCVVRYATGSDQSGAQRL